MVPERQLGEVSHEELSFWDESDELQMIYICVKNIFEKPESEHLYSKRFSSLITCGALESGNVGDEHTYQSEVTSG
jgi:hypothetical protein